MWLHLDDDVLEVLEVLTKLVVEDELGEVGALELRVLQGFVVGLVLPDLAQLVQVVLYADALLNELEEENEHC